MSTSLKVVRIAAVFCASLRRRAMVWRSRLIGARSWRPEPSVEGAGRATAGGGDFAGWGAGGGETAAGAALAAVPPIAASASALVGRPAFPLPANAEASRLFSTTILRTEVDRLGAAG